jgi:hypothetical protein
MKKPVFDLFKVDFDKGKKDLGLGGDSLSDDEEFGFPENFESEYAIYKNARVSEIGEEKVEHLMEEIYTDSNSGIFGFFASTQPKKKTMGGRLDTM